MRYDEWNIYDLFASNTIKSSVIYDVIKNHQKSLKQKRKNSRRASKRARDTMQRTSAKDTPSTLDFIPNPFPFPPIIHTHRTSTILTSLQSFTI